MGTQGNETTMMRPPPARPSIAPRLLALSAVATAVAVVLSSGQLSLLSRRPQGGPDAAVEQKLASFPHVYWINLARAEERRRHMQALLGGLKLSHSRVEAVDGSSAAFQQSLIPPPLLPEATPFLYNNWAATASHIKALSTCLNDTSNTQPFCLVAEDDLNVLDYLPHWTKPFAAYFAALPIDWVAAQMVAIVDVRLPKDCAALRIDHWVRRGHYGWWSATAYAMKKKAAEQMVADYCRQGCTTFDFSTSRTNMFTDVELYNRGRTYTLPLLNHGTLPSQVQEGDEFVVFTTKSQQYVRKLWQDHGMLAAAAAPA